jgi:GrpB-like predicted nucleotidyltransferase (UPF0157 family)
MARKIELMPYTPMFQEFYLKECKVLEKVLRNNCIEVYHIGSTAIPGIMAKPTLDILCVVHTLDGIEAFKDEFEALGLNWHGENGVEGRLYFVRLAKDGETHLSHVHIFEASNPAVADHLDFRDYLRAEEEVAKEYEKVKIEFAKRFANDPAKYTEAKSDFIQIVLKNLKEKKED